MSAQKLREYSATKIMGWIEHPDGLGDRWRIDDCYGYQLKDGWRPDQNRDQLWAVTEKYREWMNTIPGSVYTIPPPANMGEGFFYLAMSNPALALKAICEAHRATQEPAPQSDATGKGETNGNTD